MATIMRSLIAYINEQRVGQLTENAGIWSFAYSDAWLSTGSAYALSPYIPLKSEPQSDSSTQRHIQWYFDNLLPEENQRILLAKDAKIQVADAFGLLTHYGAESAGSVTLLPSDIEFVVDGVVYPLTDEELSSRIANMPKQSLASTGYKRMSLAGAQHKLAVVLEHGHLFQPQGHQPSTHILKPDHPDADYPHTVINEWFVMRLAKELSLDAPKVYRRYVPEPVYVIDRFDRHFINGQWRRSHVIDGCQLLGLDRSYKYQQGSVEKLKEMAQVCRRKIVTQQNLFKWLIFNVLIGNNDAHLKNLSFNVVPSGIELAPHYDLLCTAIYESKVYNQYSWPAQSKLAWPIMGAEFFSDVDHSVLIAAAAALGIRKDSAERWLKEMCLGIMVHAKKLLLEVEEDNRQVSQQRPDLNRFLGGEMRCVRGIFYSIITDMVQQISRYTS